MEFWTSSSMPDDVNTSSHLNDLPRHVEYSLSRLPQEITQTSIWTTPHCSAAPYVVVLIVINSPPLGRTFSLLTLERPLFLLVHDPFFSFLLKLKNSINKK
jgi:hypothetical protein